MVKKNFLKSSLIVLVAIAMILPVIPTISLADTTPSITYSAHMQTYGWDKVNQKPGDALGEAKVFAGVTGQSKRMEALEVNVVGAKLEYRAHVQGKGWMDWVTADGVADHKATVGTTGESLRVEALQLSLKDTEGRNYSILYRAHVQGKGWMDWVDASNPTAFAGTTGSSLRMEAFEIVVVPKTEFYYVNNRNGTHTVLYNGVPGETEDCVFGEYTATGSGDTGTMTRKCALCEYSDGKEATLNDVLTEAQLEGQSKVSLESAKLSKTLTIPEGMTLEVEGTLDADSKVVNVNGHLVAKSISNGSSIKCGENGVITFSGVYDDEENDDNALEDNLKFVKDSTQAKVDKIVLEKGTVAQTLSEKVELSNKVDLTLDLNGTEVSTEVTKGTNYTDSVMINNAGKLTINDGVIDAAGSWGICSTGPDSELVVNNCTIKGTTGKVITVGTKEVANKNVVATITDTKIETTGASTDEWSVTPFGTDTVVNMKNVEIKSKNGCVATNNKDNNITIVGDHVTLTSENCAAYLASSGKYTFKNSTITGTEGIEYITGTLALNNTTVKATGAKPEGFNLTTNGNATHKATPIVGTESKLGAAIQVKVFESGHDDDKAILNVDSASKLESVHGPAILVFTDSRTAVPDTSTRLDLHYTLSRLSGFTGETTKGNPVIYATYSAN